MENTAELEALCEIAYCTGLYQIDAFTCMENAFSFYDFVNTRFLENKEAESLYDFIQEENLKNLLEERNKTTNKELKD